MSVDRELLKLAAFYRNSGDVAGLQSTVSQLSKEGPHYPLALLELIKLQSKSNLKTTLSLQSENSDISSKPKHKYR